MPHGNFKHGESWATGRTREYRSFECMHSRCRNPNDQDYPRYGGRNICVCKGWDDYPTFLNDMGRCPPNHSIDRIDNNGHYSCGHCEECLVKEWKMNCKWSPPKEQANHRSSNRIVVINGISKNLCQWCEETGVPVTTAWNRLKRGVPPEEAFKKTC